jgi:small subunit ribosomal protein S6
MVTAAAAPATRWAREYETIYILRSDVDNAVAEKVVDRARDVIARLGGTLTKLDNWGTRKLAYPIQKSNRGIFVYLKYVGYSDLVAELERNLRLLDDVVRFQTVLLAEDIDPASVAVDPDEVQYLHVESEEEDEDAELERARSLGMASRATRTVPAEAPPAASEGDVPPAPAGAPKEAAEAPAGEETAEESTEAASEDDKREEG